MGQNYASVYPNIHKYPATMLPQIGIELLKEFNIDKSNLDIASLQEEYHQEKLSEIENAILEKYNIIKTKPIKMGVDKDTGLPFTYYTDGPAK